MEAHKRLLTRGRVARGGSFGAHPDSPHRAHTGLRRRSPGNGIQLGVLMFGLKDLAIAHDSGRVVRFRMFAERNEMLVNIILLHNVVTDCSRHCVCVLSKGDFVLFYGAVCFCYDFGGFLGFVVRPASK